MLDQYGRNIDYMRISVTDRCNLRCKYCMPDGIVQTPHCEILTYEEILRIVREAAKLGITKFKITGGEPLARKGCAQLVRSIKNTDGVAEVTMTTNGLLLRDNLSELLDAGLDAVNISLDTLDREKYNKLTGFRGDAISEIMDVLNECVSAKLKTKINAVLLPENKDEIVSLSSISEKLPVDVRFIELMPIGMGATMEGASPDEALATLKERWSDLHPVNEKRGNGPAHYYGSDKLIGRIGFIDAVSHIFCQSCNRVRLTSTGLLKPCLCYDTTTDLKTLLRGGATDEELGATLKEAIFSKPRSHCFDVRSNITEQNSMSQIGG